MANFTKGEWSQSHRKDKKTGMYSTEVYDSRGQTICTLAWHTEPGSTRTDRPENAALIAAAPDMYKMLEKLIISGTELLNIEDVSSEEDAATIHSNFNDDLIESLRHLKKARGE